jgi:hypothetical protein
MSRRRPAFGWASTARLLLDEDGLLWLRGRREPEYLGHVEDGPALPEGCQDELDELLDAWRDAGSREGLRAEWAAEYRASRL